MGKGNLVVLFTAPEWCVPCQRFEPHWNKAHEQGIENVVFAKVDMGANPEDTLQHWATEMFGVRGVPTVKLFTESDIIDIKARAVVPFINEVKSHG